MCTLTIFSEKISVFNYFMKNKKFAKKSVFLKFYLNKNAHKIQTTWNFSIILFSS